MNFRDYSEAILAHLIAGVIMAHLSVGLAVFFEERDKNKAILAAAQVTTSGPAAVNISSHLEDLAVFVFVIMCMMLGAPIILVLYKLFGLNK